MEYEKKFTDLESSVKNFLQSVHKFNDLLHDVVICQFNISNYFSSVFNPNRQMQATAQAAREVERFNASQKRIASTFWNDYVS